MKGEIFMHKKFLAISMISIITLNAFPVNIFKFKKETKASSFISNVSKIENPVAGGSGGNWSGNYIYFGNYPQSDTSGATKDPIRWRILDTNNKAWTGSNERSAAQANGFKYNIGSGDGKGGRQNAPIGGNGILLMSDINLDAKQYHPDYRHNNEEHKLCWGGNGGGSGKGCTLWAWLNGYNNSNVLGDRTIPDLPFLTTAFTSDEQIAIMKTEVYSENLGENLANSDRTSLTQDKIFLLSYNEMLNQLYGFTNTCSNSNARIFGWSNYSNNSKQYTDSRLRSPGYLNDTLAYASLINSSGYVSPFNNVTFVYGILPAFNLNQASVIFASKAIKGKNSAISSLPTKFELPTGKGNDYKLTLKDSSRSFSASKTAQNGNQVTISYNSAKVGSNEYISCLILDNQSEIKYYGKLEQVSSTNGTITLDIPEELESGEYIIEIFNEQCNSDYETDWGSKLSEFTVIKPTVSAPTAKTLEYTGKPQELITAGSTTGGTLQYRLDSGSYDTKIPTATNPGNYTVYYKVVGNNEYLDVAEKSVNVTIKKATPKDVPPVLQAQTKYSITLKPLEPNENGAKPEYKKDEEDWQESNVFKNLIPNKEYTFYSRYAATEDGNFAPSLPSEPAKIRTLKKSNSNFGNNNDNSDINNENDYENVSNKEDKNNNENVKTDKNKVIISDKIQQIETENGIANIKTKRSGDDIEVKITDENGNPITIEDGIILVVECDQDGSGIVAATINDDGTIEKVIRKSVVKDGKIYIPLNCSAKIRIIDNSKLFYDVFANHWAYDAVTFVSAHELFNGTAPNIFEPETPMSRAMMVQVLHNLEDNPYQVFEKIFSDVNIGDWFAEAVTWGATHRGTIIGYDDGRFGPNDNITREQLATILYRYFGENEIVDADLNFADANKISDYALKAMKWAVKYGVVQGKGNNILDPKGLATRAEVAQMFQNLMLNLFY